MKLSSTFAQFPAHKEITEKIFHLLQQDERVLGIYLSGSFVYGKPDMYSDVDFYILVPLETREQIKKDHEKLRNQVGDVISDFPATHLGDPNQFITFYRGSYPIHVDYQYRVKDELAPRRKDKDVLILLDKSGELQEWKNKCSSVEELYSPTQESLQYFEDRFWAWCIYTDSKIKRGELWEARDAIEYMRNNVLVKLAYYTSSLRSEGNRRIETKFPKEIILALELTLQKGHSRKDYAGALLELANCYVQFMGEAVKKWGIKVQEKDREYFKKYLKELPTEEQYQMGLF